MRIVPHKELPERLGISRNVSPVKALGNGWDVVSKYIETQDVYHAKNASYMPRT
jgi:hypothetical protein